MAEWLRELGSPPPHVLLLVAVTLAVVLLRYAIWKHDSREPPLISGAPVLGHLPGIYRHGTSYPVVLSAQTDQLPIYAVYLLGQKIYTVNAGEIASLLSRKNKQLDAETGFIVVVFQNMLGVDKSIMKTLVSTPKSGQKGQRTPYRDDMRTTEHRLLAPGESNRQFYVKIMNAFVQVLDDMMPSDTNSVHLMKWLEELYTRVAGAGMYGKKSPFETRPSLIWDYWLWDSNMSPFLLNFFPKYTAPEAFEARERLVDVLKGCIADTHDDDEGDQVNVISRKRRDISTKHSLSGDYLGRSELELLNGLLSNTVPAVFWMLAHTLAGSFFGSIKEEVGRSVQAEGNRLQFDIGQVRAQCPTLVATYQESLRLYASSARAYKVVQDFELMDGCLLKKGSLVYVPTETIHRNPKNWGPDVLEFKPERWMKSEYDHHPGSYAPFGVGSSICPGRHFVFDMILGSLVVLLYSLDIELAPGTAVGVPKTRLKVMSGVRLPVHDLDVVLKRKTLGEYNSERAKWAF
ncbi:hypothetical protein LTS17_012628 [Exophiala oligosperma]